MFLREILSEGGWASTATQGTKITPQTVKNVLPVVEKFVKRFNAWAKSKGITPVEIGGPLGSTAYYQRDPEDKEYGDIDLQVIAPDIEGKTANQVGTIYTNYFDEFVQETKPQELHDKKFTTNPVFQVGNDFVQVDFVWAVDSLSKWSKSRMTPPPNIKGAVHGSMFSSFGEIMNISIMGSGAQIKLVGDEIRPYATTRKYDRLDTASTDIENFGVDIVRWLHNHMNISEPLKIAPLLKQHPGLDTKEISSQQLSDVIKGVAQTFEINDMYGKANLAEFSSANDFINAFVENFTNRLQKSINSTKFDKAQSPEARKKAQDTKDKLQYGIDYVSKLMA
jgi:hypothetical protein